MHQSNMSLKCASFGGESTYCTLSQGILKTPRTPRTPTMEYISEGEEDASAMYSESVTDGEEDQSESSASFQCEYTRYKNSPPHYSEFILPFYE